MRVWMLLACLGLLVLGLAVLFPDVLAREDAQMRLVYAVGLILLLSGGINRVLRSDLGKVMKQALAWVAILIGLIAVYAYRHEMSDVAMRIGGALVPSIAVSTSDGEVRLSRARNNHFYVDAKVNGETVRMMIDTGATSIALSAAAAERAGYQPDALRYNARVRTANGEAWAAPVTIDRVQVGSIAQEGLRATVAAPGALDVSLLGQSFLRRLDAVEIRGDTMVLRP